MRIPLRDARTAIALALCVGLLAAPLVAQEGSGLRSGSEVFGKGVKADEVIQWEPTLEAAMARGAEEGKPVFISFNVNFLGNTKDPKC